MSDFSCCGFRGNAMPASDAPSSLNESKKKAEAEFPPAKSEVKDESPSAKPPNRDGGSKSGGCCFPKKTRDAEQQLSLSEAEQAATCLSYLADVATLKAFMQFPDQEIRKYVLEFTATEEAEFKKDFDRLAQRRGGIGISDFGPALESLGVRPDISVLTNVLEKLDKDTSGEITFAKYLHLMGGIIKCQENDPKTLAEFSGFDTDGNGFIDRGELARGLKVDEDAAETLMINADLNGDGQLDLAEFVHSDVARKLRRKVTTDRFKKQG